MRHLVVCHVKESASRPGFSLPALFLLTSLFACLGIATVLLTPSTGDGSPVAIGLESVRPAFAGLEWSDYVTVPATAQQAALGKLVGTTATFLGLVALMALVGLMGLEAEESARRRPEIALRRAVGASRRQLLTERLGETIVLVSISAGLALLLAALVAAVIGATWPGSLDPPWLRTSARAFGMILLGAAGFVLLRTLALSAEAAPGGVLNPDTPLDGDHVRGRGAYPLLPALQIAVAVAILATGFVLLDTDDPVADASSRNVQTDLQRLTLQRNQMDSPGSGRAADLAAVLSAVRDLPDVTSAAYASPGAALGLGVADAALADCGNCSTGGLPMPMKREHVVHHLATQDTFAALGLEILRGRGFRPSDDRNREAVAVVSEQLARRNFEEGNPLGRRIKIGETLDRWYTVVGVVEDGDRWALGSGELATGEVYLSALQHDIRNGNLLVAGLGDLSVVGSRLEDRGWEIEEAGSLHHLLEDQAAHLSWFESTWSLLGTVALLVAGLGVFVTVRLRVRQEIREIGIRRAVGARRRHVLLHYVVDSLKLGGIGGGIGLWLSLFALPHLPSLPSVGAPLMGRAAVGVVLPLLAADVLGALVPVLGACRAPPHEAIRGKV